MAHFALNKTVMRIAPHRLYSGDVPEALGKRLQQAVAPEGADVWAIVCRGRSCSLPVTDAEGLRKALQPDR